MRATSGRLRNRLALLAVVAVEYFGCATTSTGTWQVTRAARELVPSAQMRTLCGGSVCPAICEHIRDNTLEEPYRNICDQPDPNYDSSSIVGCEPRGADLVITCEWQTDKKGCIPDS